VVVGAVILDPGSVFAWLLAGLVAGAIAGRITRGRGYGCCQDIVLGLIGAFLGGLIVSPFIHGRYIAHFLGTTAIALIGALALILALRFISRVL
jgi:uncharacterized membrane protein YeaQ/YmgE (transglycosylase-associated protein family)